MEQVHLKEKRKPCPLFSVDIGIFAVHGKPPYTLKISPSIVYSSIGVDSRIESVVALRVFQYHISKLGILHSAVRRHLG